jgi:hypothetical protein
MSGVRETAGGGVVGEWSWTIEVLREPVALAIVGIAAAAGLLLSKVK